MGITTDSTINIMKANPRFVTYNNRGDNFISYGRDNGYPTLMQRLLHASPSGVACRNKLVEFIVGKGFENPEYNKLVINRKSETLYQILDQISADLSDYNSFHLHIIYNLNLDIDSIVRIDPEHVRKSSPDSYGFSPKAIIFQNWYRDNYTTADQSYKQHEVDVYTENKKAINRQIEKAGSFQAWNGHVLSYWANASVYPKTIYDSVLDDLQTDTLMSRKNKIDLEKGYMAGTVFVFKNKMTQTERNATMSHVNEVQGSEGNRILVIDGAEDGVEVKTIQTNFSDGQFTLTEQRVRRAIFRVFGQLPILHGEDRSNAISADGKAIQTAFELYNNFTLKKRLTLSENIAKLMQKFKNPINDEFAISPMFFGEYRELESKNKKNIEQ